MSAEEPTTLAGLLARHVYVAGSDGRGCSCGWRRSRGDDRSLQEQWAERHVAQVVLASDWLAEHDAEIRGAVLAEGEAIARGMIEQARREARKAALDECERAIEAKLAEAMLAGGGLYSVSYIDGLRYAAQRIVRSLGGDA